MIWVAWVVLDMDCVFAWSSNYTLPYPAQVHAHMITYPYLLGGETYIYIHIYIYTYIYIHMYIYALMYPGDQMCQMTVWYWTFCDVSGLRFHAKWKETLAIHIVVQKTTSSYVIHVDPKERQKTNCDSFISAHFKNDIYVEMWETIPVMVSL